MSHLRWVMAAVLLAVGCAPLQPFYFGHGTSHDGVEYHTCRTATDHWECREGYACSKDGCEWCGDEDGVDTRCTNALDSNPGGY